MSICLNAFLYITCKQYPRGPKDGVGHPLTRITEGCKQLFRYSKLNPGPPEQLNQ